MAPASMSCGACGLRGLRGSGVSGLPLRSQGLAMLGFRFGERAVMVGLSSLVTFCLQDILNHKTREVWAAICRSRVLLSIVGVRLVVFPLLGGAAIPVHANSACSPPEEEFLS